MFRECNSLTVGKVQLSFHEDECSDVKIFMHITGFTLLNMEKQWQRNLALRMISMKTDASLPKFTTSC